MKIFLFLSFCVALALGCSNLPKLETCNNQDGSPDCSCETGMSCVLTKNFIYNGNTITVKQCMPESLDIEVETVDLDNQVADEPMRNKRWLFNRCTTEADCDNNYCCAFGRRCSMKLRQHFTCYLVHKHGCGCADGLACKVTSTITLPFGIKIPIRQCE
ncbi:hypothetical protein OS493_037906 [Desmophyllum pertusum]|uniref:Uncharacterized protein n=1 Tax=Desmophyllum pertusum TaxID=174260 RepID=A0A9X0CVL8_9CNID|nr:hypothetical protein OS493_037906 [Desmophyllum pertusum]